MLIGELNVPTLDLVKEFMNKQQNITQQYKLKITKLTQENSQAQQQFKKGQSPELLLEVGIVPENQQKTSPLKYTSPLKTKILNEEEQTDNYIQENLNFLETLKDIETQGIKTPEKMDILKEIYNSGFKEGSGHKANNQTFNNVKSITEITEITDDLTSFMEGTHTFGRTKMLDTMNEEVQNPFQDNLKMTEKFNKQSYVVNKSPQRKQEEQQPQLGNNQLKNSENEDFNNMNTLKENKLFKENINENEIQSPKVVNTQKSSQKSKIQTLPPKPEVSFQKESEVEEQLEQLKFVKDQPKELPPKPVVPLKTKTKSSQDFYNKYKNSLKEKKFDTFMKKDQQIDRISNIMKGKFRASKRQIYNNLSSDSDDF